MNIIKGVWTAHIVTGAVVFPTYATYKALTMRPDPFEFVLGFGFSIGVGAACGALVVPMYYGAYYAMKNAI
jgi:hypothetical protein